MAAARRTACVLLIVGVFQAAACMATALLGPVSSPLFALYVMAYTLGMRHALDADHIAAIDNVSRSMLNRGEQPTGVGLYFALGHSGVVSVATLLVAAGASRLQVAITHYQGMVASFATILSASILIYMVPRNLCIAWRIYRSRHRATTPPSLGSGLVSRLLGRFLTARLSGWHMLIIGAIFGLGFETATALGMIALVGTQSAHGVRMSALLVFPLLFTAGMVLVDSLDGVLMEWAYGWALRRPQRHVVYNLGVTLVSAGLALMIGLVEVTTALKQYLAIHGGVISDFVEGHMDLIGAAVIVCFASAYAVSALRPVATLSRTERRPDL